MTKSALIQLIKDSKITNTIKVINNGNTWRINLLEGEYMAKSKITLNDVAISLQAIQGDIKNIQGDIKIMQSDIKLMKDDIKVLKDDVALIKSLPTVKKEISELK